MLASGSLSAQILGFGLGVGIKGGWAPTDVAKSNSPLINLQSSSNYIVGPVAELRIPFGFALEVDGLYHHADYGGRTTSGGPAYGKVSSWEIPYMAKFRLPIPLLKPFLLAGGSYRTFTNSQAKASNNGFVTGLGLELRVSRFRASAEGRYIRWGESPHGLVVFPQDQTEILFGITF